MKIDNNVYFLDCAYSKYDNTKSFNPSDVYPEGLDINFKTDPIVYDKIRNVLIDMDMDKANIGTIRWNPFGEFIKKKNSVLIKPNLVNNINYLKSGGLDELVTNIAFIRPIIDYCLIALEKSGKLVVADSPVQECDFEDLINKCGLKALIETYADNGYNVLLKDLRNSKECTKVSINKNSSHCEKDQFSKKYAITNYNLKKMHEHHQNGIHEYLISNIALEADIIINIPKPKSHRKAGFTACMKNFVGVNTSKEYLPHHKSGSISDNGDEFPENSFIKKVYSFLSNYSYKKNIFINFIQKCCYALIKILKEDKYLEGSWFGNDTIWRTILDLNKIINYSDKKGTLKAKKQRIIFNIADMIVCGEKEGPLKPTRKETGYIICGFNQLNVDNEICKIMGFNNDKIRYLLNGFKLNKYVLSDGKYVVYSKKRIIDLKKYNKHFLPTDGWKDGIF